jgi:prevent-host-death family protein
MGLIGSIEVRTLGVTMPPAIPEPEFMKISDVRAKLSSLVKDVRHHKRRILIERAGIPVAALISAEDLVRYERYEREWEDRFTVYQLQNALKDVLPEDMSHEVISIISKLRSTNRGQEERRRVLDAMRAPFLNVPPEEIERETAKALAEVRAEMKAEREAAAKGLSFPSHIELGSDLECR